jgi:beta-lactam-binding protein with PASTA domain
MSSGPIQSIKRFFAILGGSIAMIAVALVCAFLAMRLAIHGREVAVPNLAGLSDAGAANAAKDLGLNLSVENRFYSAAVPPNHVLSQSPVAGARVRRGWEVRVTESLGGQKVAVPDLTGMTERPASLVLRRLQLELGSVGHLPAPSPSGIVLAQSPPANSREMSSPRVGVLVADDETEAETPAFVMPFLTGLSLSAASLKLATAGLHITTAQSPEDPPLDAPTTDGTYVPPMTVTTAATITSQSPAPGHRVTRADTIRVTLSH